MGTALALVALPAASVTIWALLRSPVARRLVSVPTAERWHATTTPNLGGIGIFLGFSVGLWSAAAAGAFTPSHALVGIYCAIALVFVAGLADDLFGLPPLAKLAAQGGAAAIVIATGTHVQLVHNQVLGDAIAVTWLIGLTNAFNLLDNIDGLAASLAAIAFGFFAVDAVTEHPSDAALAFALAGAFACLGFLPFNLRGTRPALVFMGDSGSQTLGFALAALGLSSSWLVAGTTVATLMLPVLILAVPILDTSLVTIVRLLDGRPIYQGGRDHSSHRLVRFGLTESHAVALLALISLCIGGSSLAYTTLQNTRYTIVGVVLTFALLLQFGSFLADVDRRATPLEAPLGFTQAFAVHWRRLVEVLVDFVLITGSYYAAYVIRFGWPGTDTQALVRHETLPIVLAVRYLVFIPFGLYRPVWRYAGARDVVKIAEAVFVSEFIAVAVIVFTQNLYDFNRSFFVIDAIICTAAIAGSRLAERTLVVGTKAFDRAARRTLIVGAGRTGRSMMREVRETAGERVVGFVDDNARLRRRSVHGIKVRGMTHELPQILERTRPDIVLVTIPDAPRERLDAVVDACAKAEVECRFVRREIDLDPRVVFGATAE